MPERADTSEVIGLITSRLCSTRPCPLPRIKMDDERASILVLLHRVHNHPLDRRFPIAPTTIQGHDEAVVPVPRCDRLCYRQRECTPLQAVLVEAFDWPVGGEEMGGLGAHGEIGVTAFSANRSRSFPA